MEKKSLVQRVGERYGVDPNKVFSILKELIFRQRDGSTPTNEQMMALLVVADQYRLNPFTREIYAFPDRQNGIVPVVGVDGWIRITNEHPQYDGIEFVYAEEQIELNGKTFPQWVEAVIYRKDRTHPTRVREYLEEVYRHPIKYGNGKTATTPWQTHTRRQLRHKAYIQAARVAFGFAVYDPDEAERIVEGQAETTSNLSVASPQVKKLFNPSEVDAVIARAKGQGAVEAGLSYVKERFGEAAADYYMEQTLPEAETVEVEPPPEAEAQVSEPIEVAAPVAEMVGKLATHAAQTGRWDSAEEYARGKLEGDALQYALNTLKEGRKGVLHAS